MTIAVAIRTGSALVFAADSKVTTSGVVGLEEDGSPRWVRQTYDNATKVVHDRSETVMAMVAGDANIGRIAAVDYISTRDLREWKWAGDQPQQVEALTKDMMEQKRQFWSTTEIPPEKWPGPTVILGVPSSDGIVPRAWSLLLHGSEPKISEILTLPWIWLEGAYDEILGLLYGYEPSVLEAIADHFVVEKEFIWEVAEHLRVLRPIEKLNLSAMPIQDAIELAVFLAKAQVQMDRFLPGTPACGGPIDVMVLRMAPEIGIVSYPGKVLHHPDLLR